MTMAKQRVHKGHINGNLVESNLLQSLYGSLHENWKCFFIHKGSQGTKPAVGVWANCQKAITICLTPAPHHSPTPPQSQQVSSIVRGFTYDIWVTKRISSTNLIQIAVQFQKTNHFSQITSELFYCFVVSSYVQQLQMANKSFIKCFTSIIFPQTALKCQLIWMKKQLKYCDPWCFWSLSIYRQEEQMCRQFTLAINTILPYSYLSYTINHCNSFNYFINNNSMTIQVLATGTLLTYNNSMIVQVLAFSQSCDREWMSTSFKLANCLVMSSIIPHLTATCL